MYHRITISPYYSITVSLYHRIPVSPYHCITASLYHRIRVSPYHCITVSVYHTATESQFVSVWRNLLRISRTGQHCTFNATIYTAFILHLANCTVLYCYSDRVNKYILESIWRLCSIFLFIDIETPHTLLYFIFLLLPLSK